MNTAEQILVIITSSLLSLSLLLGIVVLIFVLRLVATIKRIAAKGEQVIDSAEAAAETFARAAGPLGVLKSIVNIVDSVNKHKKGK
ncbi:MAG: hypothetical protein ACREGB_02100 [Candidatus Saccharimonadales bacterium]